MILNRDRADQKMMKLQKTIIVATIVSIVGILAFLIFGRELEDILQEDVLSTTYQFFIIVVAGGGVSWLYKELSRSREHKQAELSRNREREQADREELFKFHSNLVSAYNSYKEIKRLLRAKAWRTISREEGGQQEALRIESYDQLLERLNKIQLAFESYKRRVEGRSDLFQRFDKLYKKEKANTIHDDIENIETYLNNIVKEYETALRDHDCTQTYLPLEKLEKVKAFMAPHREATKDRIAAETSFRSAISKLGAVASDDAFDQ